jgi:hypothetical protein
MILNIFGSFEEVSIRIKKNDDFYFTGLCREEDNVRALLLFFRPETNPLYKANRISGQMYINSGEFNFNAKSTPYLGLNTNLFKKPLALACLPVM